MVKIPLYITVLDIFIKEAIYYILYIYYLAKDLPPLLLHALAVALFR